MACPGTASFIRACDFTQLLVDQQPKYDKLIIETIRPTDGWIGHVATGTFPDASGVGMYQDRFEHVWPDTRYAWTDMITENAGNANVFGIDSCAGHPCDIVEHCLQWGSSRLHYGLEKQSWATPLLCFDQLMHVTHAKEQWRYIISDILKPATSTIMSDFLRKRALQWAGVRRGLQRWVADSLMTSFTYVWQLDAQGREATLCTSAMPQSKLTPQMLQRRVNRLLHEGYYGKQPFKDSIPLIELVTDMETCWELDKLATTGGVPSVTGNWRFQQWDAANKYWRYGFSGQLGNYAVRVDPHQMRFNYMDANGPAATPFRFQRVMPYTTQASGGAGGASGIRDDYNMDYERAQYRLSFIHHQKAMECLVADATAINPEMPFASRNFGGRWQFVMDNLGADPVTNLPIENKRRNKGQFIADFKQAIRPLYIEFEEAILHKAEPAYVIEIDTCAADPGYPTQTFDNCTDPCD